MRASRFKTPGNGYTDSAAGIGGTTAPALFGANFDFALNRGPNLLNTNGIGVIANAMNPNSVDAQRGFRRSYICSANRGKPAPNHERTTVFAASADAAAKR